ncbi:MAG: alpha-mannosidase [Clostridia bacterium]|nr:alpha-mannosidase [Clostridia bacterium]
MNKIHLLCNAHLDPVWLWPREEGVAEAISTFRVAADFCEQYDSFIFNHNEAVLYEWVEEHEPVLFARIQKLVKEGKWHILGGWYLQPDCLMPSAEGFLRQIEVGNRYFMEKFGVKPTTAINFDSFGHTRGLVQIMKKSGYDSYIFMRPNGIIPEHDFIWKGADGSTLHAHCIRGGYNTNRGTAKKRLERVIEGPHTNPELMLWGIGNHGGGPSKVDLEAINETIREHPEVEILHSTGEDYMADVDWSKVKTEERSMQHIFVGCYTSMSRVKQAYRAIENELITTEKMMAAAGIEGDLSEAEKAMLFSQFHDVLPGTMIKKAEDQILRLLGYGREILNRMSNKAFFRLAEGQPKGKPGEIPVLVFNPHPYPVTQQIEIEFQLSDQNWTENQVTLVKVRDEQGNYLPAQNEKESSSLNLDWRKRVVFEATLQPMCINRFDCELYIEAASKRPIAPCPETETHYTFDNGTMQVRINKETGLLDQYTVNGIDYLKAGSARLRVFKDHEDPWKMDNQIYAEQIGSFEAVSAEEANAFRGYPDAKHPNLLVIENGDVRTKLQAVLKNRSSYAVVTYILPKNGSHIDLQIKLLANDANTMYKLTFDTPLKDADFIGQTAYGIEPLRKDGQEVCYQKWCAFKGENACFAVLNKGHYGGSAEEGKLNISVLRTPVYSAHPIPNRQLTDDDRNHDHVDMGEHDFEFRLTVDGAHLDKDAESFNQQVYAFSFFPSGAGEKKDTSLSLSNQKILLTSCRKQGDQLLLRLYNGSETAETVTLTTKKCNFTLQFTSFEAKALVLEGEKLTETSLSFIE